MDSLDERMDEAPAFELPSFEKWQSIIAYFAKKGVREVMVGDEGWSALLRQDDETTLTLIVHKRWGKKGGLVTKYVTIGKEGRGYTDHGCVFSIASPTKMEAEEAKRDFPSALSVFDSFCSRRTMDMTPIRGLDTSE